MVLSQFATGTLLAFASSIAFGTQTSFAKIPSVIACNIRMEVFNIYFLIGVTVVCFIAHLILYTLIDPAISFSFMGIISGLLLYFGELFTLLSVQQIGIAYGMALSVFSSAVTGIVIQHMLGQSIQNYALTILGLIAVTVSVIGAAFLKQILSFFNPMDYAKIEKATLSMPRQESVVQIFSETTPFMAGNDESSDNDEGNEADSSNAYFIQYTKRMALGFVYSSMGGICYCSVPLPSLFVDEYSAGIKFSLSFGIGCLIVLPLSIFTVALMNCIRAQHEEEDELETTFSVKDLCWSLVSFDEELWHFSSACLAGIGAGCVWGLGNLVGICTFLYLPYVVVAAYVQFHCVVSLLWGICLWKEITQIVEMIAISALTLTLIGGCIMVTFGVYGVW
eukprot:CAMPEP_0197028298 /NCGR_PEP_ID=MMETSP1384-20130603/8014_1 /TAXON_ID=29189 /ORGANISM="Ammonia sp." /LENGTH=392 /DNA_ID=CAMNT_0042457277 /DNA_START=78 /DNA_END=1253 /DNA_ORIENTATION=+